MGQNKLNSLMKTMAEKGGLSGERLTITARILETTSGGIFVYFHYNNKTLVSYVYMFTKPV